MLRYGSLFVLLGFSIVLWADTTTQNLPFSQNWTDTSLITTDDDWGGVPGIVGYRGDDVTTATGTDPRTILADGTNTPVDVNANQTSPNTFATGGIAEFHLADPVIALNGSGTADAPFILISVNTTGKSSIRVKMNLRDLDGSVDNAVTQVAIQYRVGASGNFTNVFYVPDATTGPNLAVLVIPVDVMLPANADNQPLVQVRVITTNAVGNDEWVGIDDIEIDGSAGPLSLSPSTLPNGTSGIPYSEVLTVQNNQGQSCAFAASGTLPTGLLLNAATPTTITLSGTPSEPGTFDFVISADCGSAGIINPSYTVIITAPSFVCEIGAKTSTAIHSIQGSGPTSPMVGTTVEVEGIVVGDFQLSTQLRGFYLEEPEATWDSDPLTSEGVFVFDNLNGVDVNIGDRVRVKGTVAEFSSNGTFLGSTQTSSLTEIGNIQGELVCSSQNTVPPASITLPVASEAELERFEGMVVELTQRLTVTGNFNLGTFGQIDLAPSLLYTPTSSANRSTWPTQTSLNRRSVIALDDNSTLSNTALYPTLFPQGGLSAANTLRVGAYVNSPLLGVLDDRFGEYRIQPTSPVTFDNAKDRPAIAPILTSIGSRFRAVSANVLNFFTTFGSRGAANQTEFNHQKTKIIEELTGIDADVYGLSEVQNFANGGTNGGLYTNEAVQSLVDGMNCKLAGNSPTCASPPSVPFGFIDTLALGASNGTDAIRNVIVYRVDRLLPVGAPALYYQGDTNRPSLAQTFQPLSGPKASQQTFTFVVNHFRARGSSCGTGNDDPYQGNCNGTRLSMATNVESWLLQNPTNDPASLNRKLLLVGDFNAYFGEDPIQYFGQHGYQNLIASILGENAYSYNFGSQAGYLDHAMANTAMNLLVKSIAEWHNNADEPASLQALDGNLKSPAAQGAYYAPDPYAASDHDPIVIGFNPLPGDLNDDGLVSGADQQMISSAIGKSASEVDRRMDYDGDGRITLNDYRIWTGYFRAFVQ
jgi:predicted extracellular nuclease